MKHLGSQVEYEIKLTKILQYIKETGKENGSSLHEDFYTQEIRKKGVQVKKGKILDRIF